MSGTSTPADTGGELAAILAGAERLAPWRGASDRYVAVPKANDPRQLLPWHWTTARATAHRQSDDRGITRRIRDVGAVSALLVSRGVTRSRRGALVGDYSLVDHVAEQLDMPEARAIVLCGPPRSNRKPVLQMFDRSGRTVAFVKVGWNDLTRRLVAAEQQSLEHVAQRATTIRVPEILGSGRLGEAAWLAVAPVGVARRQRPTAASIDEIAVSIERSGRPWSGRAQESTYVKRLVADARDVPRSREATERLLDRYEDATVSEGGAHGDFVPWNVQSGQPMPAVWDWERYRPDGLLGYDRMHHRIQVGLHRSSEAFPATLRRIAGEIDTVLPQLSVHQRECHLDFYLADLMCRYERDVRAHPAPLLPELIVDLSDFLKERSPRP